MIGQLDLYTRVQSLVTLDSREQLKMSLPDEVSIMYIPWIIHVCLRPCVPQASTMSYSQRLVLAVFDVGPDKVPTNF
jgi:hypothetical protein